MSKTPKETKEPLKPKPSKGVYLSLVIGKEITEILNQYENEQKIELAEHLIQTFDDLSAYFKTREESVYRRYADRETQLLKKYGKDFKAFSEKSFYKLFDFDTILLEKDYYTSKEFNSLKTNEGDLTEEAVMEFVNLMKRRLHGEIYYLYLEREPQFETKEKGVGSSIQDETDKDITEARQLLAIYFLLKAGFDIEHRGSNSVSEITRFAHLMTGTKFTTLQKSNIYKKYQLIPNYNKAEYLIKDLRFIRTYFVELHIQKAIDLIDKEIEMSINELPISKRKQYRA
jgi:hypothetical protein